MKNDTLTTKPQFTHAHAGQQEQMLENIAKQYKGTTIQEELVNRAATTDNNVYMGFFVHPAQQQG